MMVSIEVKTVAPPTVHAFSVKDFVAVMMIVPRIWYAESAEGLTHLPKLERNAAFSVVTILV